MANIPPIDPKIIEQVSEVFDKFNIFNHGQINDLLEKLGIENVSLNANSGFNRKDKLAKSLIANQKKYNSANKIIEVIEQATNPILHSKKIENIYIPGKGVSGNNLDFFNSLLEQINLILVYAGFIVDEQGKVNKTTKAKTINEAYQRFNRLKNKLEQRGIHKDILKFCATEIKDDNYFHTVFEAIKALSSKIQLLAKVNLDGSNLVDNVFLGQNPILLFNQYQISSEKSEQKGIANLIKGLFSAVRNPIAHETKISWYISEQDALDILALVSFIYRKLDKTTLNKQQDVIYL